jgi:hypothetical protein
MLAGRASSLGRSQKHGRFPMQKRLAIVVSAVIALALPQFALAHTSNGHQGTSGGCRATSAALPKAEIAQLRSHFRLVPEGTKCIAA